MDKKNENDPVIWMELLAPGMIFSSLFTGELLSFSRKCFREVPVMSIYISTVDKLTGSVIKIWEDKGGISL